MDTDANVQIRIVVRIPDKLDIARNVVDGTIDCWLDMQNPHDPAHANFSRADRQGRMVLV